MKYLFPAFLILVSVNISAQQNIIPNGGFEEGMTPWITSSGGSSQANYEITSNDPASGDSCLQVNITQLGSNYWDLQAQNFDLGLTEGTGYKISLKAKASSSGILLNFIIGKATEDYAYYSANRNISLTEQWEEYTYSFVSPVTSDDDVAASLQFVSSGTVWVDDITVIASAVSNINVNTDGGSIKIEFSGEMEDPANEPQITFFVDVNGNNNAVTNVKQSSSNLRIFTLSLADDIFEDDTVTVQYIPGTIATRVGIEINAFSMSAKNNSSIIPSALNSMEISDFSLYPVPVKDILYLKNSGTLKDFTLQIIDLSGKKLSAEILSNSTISEINVEYLQSGMYILILKAKNSMEMKHFKFIKN